MLCDFILNSSIFRVSRDPRRLLATGILHPSTLLSAGKNADDADCTDDAEEEDVGMWVDGIT